MARLTQRGEDSDGDDNNIDYDDVEDDSDDNNDENAAAAAAADDDDDDDDDNDNINIDFIKYSFSILKLQCFGSIPFARMTKYKLCGFKEPSWSIRLNPFEFTMVLEQLYRLVFNYKKK